MDKALCPQPSEEERKDSERGKQRIQFLIIIIIAAATD